MNNIKEWLHCEISHKILSIIAFTAMFSIIGWAIPETYYKYFDKTEYYKIINPVEIGAKDYHACDFTDAYINRISLINGHAGSIINLTLIRENDGEIVDDRITTTYKEISITKGSGIIVTHWEIPCSVETGKYYYDGVVEYEVRGIKKYTKFVTKTFDVKE